MWAFRAGGMPVICDDCYRAIMAEHAQKNLVGPSYSVHFKARFLIERLGPRREYDRRGKLVQVDRKWLEGEWKQRSKE